MDFLVEHFENEFSADFLLRLYFRVDLIVGSANAGYVKIGFGLMQRRCHLYRSLKSLRDFGFSINLVFSHFHLLLKFLPPLTKGIAIIEVVCRQNHSPIPSMKR